MIGKWVKGRSSIFEFVIKFFRFLLFYILIINFADFLSSLALFIAFKGVLFLILLIKCDFIVFTKSLFTFIISIFQRSCFHFWFLYFIVWGTGHVHSFIVIVIIHIFNKDIIELVGFFGMIAVRIEAFGLFQLIGFWMLNFHRVCRFK